MFLLTLAISPCWTQLSKKDVVSVTWQKICIKYKFYNPFSLKFLKHSNGPLYPLKSPLEQGQNYCCLHMMVSANVVKSSFLHFTWKNLLIILRAHPPDRLHLTQNQAAGTVFLQLELFRIFDIYLTLFFPSLC